MATRRDRTGGLAPGRGGRISPTPLAGAPTEAVVPWGVVGTKPITVPGRTVVDATPTPAPGAGQPSQQQRNAYEAIVGMLKQYSLESLAPRVLELIQQGYDSTAISVLLQDTPEYKQRFAGNEARKAAGLPVLDPATYIATESAYRQVMQSYGLPAGFYDDPSDFAGFIGKDLSPREIETRVSAAASYVNNANPEARRALAQFYPELNDGDLIANMLDPDRATGLIEKKIRAAEIGAAALQQGLEADRERAERYADMGVDAEGARRGFAQVATVLPDTRRIAARWGETYDQADAEQEMLGGLASARRKREQLNRKEESLFRGSSGVGQASLKRPTSGSY